MKRQFFSGNTLEQAVMLAARHFGIDPERVAYTLREKKHGFIKVRRRVMIEVDATAPERSPEETEPGPPAEVGTLDSGSDQNTRLPSCSKIDEKSLLFEQSASSVTNTMARIALARRKP